MKVNTLKKSEVPLNYEHRITDKGFWRISFSLISGRIFPNITNIFEIVASILYLNLIRHEEEEEAVPRKIYQNCKIDWIFHD